MRGTRVPVRAIVVAWREYHDIPTLLEAYPRLTADAVKEALAYHDAHRRELDDLISAQLAAHAALADDLQPSESVLAEQPSQTGQHLG